MLSDLNYATQCLFGSLSDVKSSPSGPVYYFFPSLPSFLFLPPLHPAGSSFLHWLSRPNVLPGDHLTDLQVIKQFFACVTRIRAHHSYSPLMPSLVFSPPKSGMNSAHGHDGVRGWLSVN